CSNVTRYATEEGKLREQLHHPRFILRHLRVELAVDTLEIGIDHEARDAVSGSGDVDRVQVMIGDSAIQVDVDEVQPRRGSPMSEKAWLHVLGSQGNLEQRVVVKIDLVDQEVVGRAPIGVHLLDEIRRNRLVHGLVLEAVMLAGFGAGEHPGSGSGATAS